MREEIKKAMKAQGLPASTLAEKAGVRIASFTEYVAGRKELRSDNLEKIFEVLGIKLKTADELADSFTKGSLYPIYEKMVAEIPQKGIVGNKQIDKIQLSSYLFGLLAARVASVLRPEGDKSFFVLDKIVFQETAKSPYLFNRSALKIATCAELLDDYEKKLFANLCVEIPYLGTDEMDNVSFIAAFMRYFF